MHQIACYRNSRTKWAPIEVKSLTLSVVKGHLTNERFHIGNEPIPTILEKPIKSLGRWYNAEISSNLNNFSGMLLMA